MTLTKTHLVPLNGCQEEGNVQESIQSNTTSDPVHHIIWESNKNIRKRHIQESHEVSPIAGCKEQTRQYDMNHKKQKGPTKEAKGVG